MVPKTCFLTKGKGVHKEKLTSFEMALRDAGIAALNLVRVSSIFPPNCKVVSVAEGKKFLRPGQIAFTVISDNATNEPHRLIAASVGIAVPRDKNLFGYLSEHHSFGETEKEAGDYAEDLAAGMLATTLGLEFDVDKSWDANKEIYQLHDHIVTARSLTQSAVGDKNGLWTTVMAGAIFVEFDLGNGGLISTT
jgi:arginine decarboxylase